VKRNGTWKMGGYKWREMVGSCLWIYIFDSNMISSRYYIVLSSCIPPRTPSPSSLQMS
jgi:hypothetical protein